MYIWFQNKGAKNVKTKRVYQINPTLNSQIDYSQCRMQCELKHLTIGEVKYGCQQPVYGIPASWGYDLSCSMATSPAIVHPTLICLN
jgi:hypothetical protein